MYRSIYQLHGFSIVGTNGNAGHLDDVIFDQANWQALCLMVDTGDLLTGPKQPVSVGTITHIEDDVSRLKYRRN